MIDVTEDVEDQWHVKLQRKLQQRIRRWLGIPQVEEGVATAISIAHETSKTVHNVALAAKEIQNRLHWHEGHSEVMRMSAASYEKNKRQGNSVEKPASKILLLDRTGNGSA